MRENKLHQVLFNSVHEKDIQILEMQFQRKWWYLLHTEFMTLTMHYDQKDVFCIHIFIKLNFKDVIKITSFCNIGFTIIISLPTKINWLLDKMQLVANKMRKYNIKL